MPMVYNVPFAEYLRMPGVHFSTLRHMATSPLHYREACAKDTTDTTSTIMGRLAHSLILTPELPETFAVFEGKQRRGKVWDEFSTAMAEAGREVVRAEELSAARRMRDAVMRNPAARDLLARGHGEVTVTWEESITLPLDVVIIRGGAVPCRARVDFISDTHGLVELKTTRHISARSWQREVAARHYHAQIAHYLNGIMACGNEERAATWIVVENGPPYDVAVYRIGDDTIERGAALAQGWLRQIAECEASGRWPGVGGDGPRDFVLPDYAADGEEDADVSGIEGSTIDG